MMSIMGQGQLYRIDVKKKIVLCTCITEYYISNNKIVFFQELVVSFSDVESYCRLRRES